MHTLTAHSSTYTYAFALKYIHTNTRVSARAHATPSYFPTVSQE